MEAFILLECHTAMSAFFLTFNRDGSTFSQSIAEKMMSALDVFGQDVQQLYVQENFAIGFQTQCLSKSKCKNKNKRQLPIVNRGQEWFLFDGRIDNRQELFTLLSLPVDATITDTQLMVQVYQQYGEGCVQKVVGPFVFVHFDTKKSQLIALRDAMGGRYLVYAKSGNALILATWEGVLCAHPEFGIALDHTKLAHTLGFIATPQPRSYIKNIESVKPGHQLRCNNGNFSQELAYLPDPTKRIYLSNDQEYASEFRRLLDQSVRRRMRLTETGLDSTNNIGVMLSGGLDSVPVAISAAISTGISTAATTEMQSNRLQAFSWTFSEHDELNETAYSSKLCQAYDIEQHLLDCDQLWPCSLSDFDINPVVPVNTPYAIKHQAILQSAQQHQVSTLLSGYAGDVLYSGTQTILYELLTSGQLVDLMREMKVRFRHSNSLRAFVSRYLITPLQEKISINRAIFKKPMNIEYLSEYANDQLSSAPHWLSDRAQSALRPQQYINVLDHSIGENLAQARYFDALYGIQKCYPFRDRDLLEFMLAIPSKQLFHNAKIRPIVKRAFAAELDECLVQRNDKTSFYPFLLDGLKQDTTFESLLTDQNELWCKFINDCEFMSNNAVQAPVDLLKWICAYYQHWSNTIMYH